jgi:hypothetical protein
LEHHQGAQLLHGGYQGIKFDRATRLDVLQHRGLESTQFERHGVAVFGLLVNRNSQSCPDFLGLQHDARDTGAHQLITQNKVGGRAGQGADRVHGHVAPQLVPDVALNLLGYDRLETGAAQQRGELAHALGLDARRRADDQLVAEVVVHVARQFEGATGMYHAAN